MARYRMVRTEFWKNPIVLEEMTPEDKYFYLYLLTNPYTTQIGIYRITKKQMAFDLGYSMESVNALMERFTNHHQLIRYNPETRELAIKNWGRDNLQKGGKPIMDCILSELKDVEDLSLILYVSASIPKQEIRNLYESFYEQEMNLTSDPVDKKPNRTEEEMIDDTFVTRHTIRGQKQKEKENKKEKQKQQQNIYPDVQSYSNLEPSLSVFQQSEEVKEIIEFWDANGFGISNIYAKQQLLSWLDDSSFLQPKEMILKAMHIACANNKRNLGYIVGILKNWENKSLLTVEEVDSSEEYPQFEHKARGKAYSFSGGRVIPNEFTLDLTAGEES